MALEQAEHKQHNAQQVQQIMKGVQNALLSPPAQNEKLTEEVANIATQVSHQSQVIPQHLIQKIQQMQTIIHQNQQQPHYYPSPLSFQQLPFQHIPPPQNNPQLNPWTHPRQPHDQFHGGRGGRGRGCGHERGCGGGGRGRGHGPPNGPKILHYCWTHGGCNHTGAECNNPAQGHQVNAAFANANKVKKKMLISKDIYIYMHCLIVF
jgi:hypothetical protein